jgi:hypothetical protein
MRKTNLNHWRKVAQNQPPDDWLLRSELASYFIRPDDVVCDLGAGAQAIRSLLPPTTGYIAVDCVQEHEGTFFADFNQDFLLPDEPFGVILCLGLLRYINDLPRFFGRLAETQAGKFIIFTYGFGASNKSNSLVANRISGLRHGFEFFSQWVDDLTVLGCISKSRDRFMFSGVLRGHGGPSSRCARRSLAEITCKNLSFWDDLRARVRKSPTKLAR